MAFDRGIVDGIGTVEICEIVLVVVLQGGDNKYTRK